MHSSRKRNARLLTVSKHALMGEYLPMGGYLPGGYLPRGVYLLGVPAQVLPPPVNRTTDRCKNITLPQTSFTGGKYKQKVEFSCNIARECYVT